MLLQITIKKRLLIAILATMSSNELNFFKLRKINQRALNYILQISRFKIQEFS